MSDHHSETPQHPARNPHSEIRPSAEGPQFGNPHSGLGGGILVVEDNPINLELMKDLLVTRGYTVYEATTGQKALTIARILKPQMVVLDIQLPGIDGLTVARLLKSEPETAETIIVAVTAHALKIDEEKARQSGCAAYVTKPIDTRAFSKLLAGLLNAAAS